MKTIFALTFQSSRRNPFLLLWSIVIPIGSVIILGKFIKSPDFPMRIATGMTALSILFFSFMTTSFSILSQRRRGVYNLLRMVPMPLWKYVLSLSCAWACVSFLCAVLVMLSGVLSLKLSVSLEAFFLLTLISMAATLGYIFFGFFTASLCKTENNLSILTNVITMPMLFCSDAFYSLENAPEFVKLFSRFNPFQWFVSGLRSGLQLNWVPYLSQLCILVLLAIGTLLLSLKTFRYTNE